MGGHRELQRAGGGLLLEADVAALLAENYPAVAPEGVDEPVVSQLGTLLIL